MCEGILLRWLKRFISFLIRIFESASKAFIVKKDGKEIAVVTREGYYIPLGDEEKEEDTQ